MTLTANTAEGGRSGIGSAYGGGGIGQKTGRAITAAALGVPSRAGSPPCGGGGFQANGNGATGSTGGAVGGLSRLGGGGFGFGGPDDGGGGGFSGGGGFGGGGNGNASGDDSRGGGAGLGGAVFSMYGSVTAVNSTVTGNRALGGASGGGERLRRRPVQPGWHGHPHQCHPRRQHRSRWQQ